MIMAFEGCWQTWGKSFLQNFAGLRALASTLTFLGVLFLHHMPACADVVPSPVKTVVYFQKDGEPHSEPVDFTINCYGCYVSRDIGTCYPGDMENVFSFTATCPHYGCEIDIPSTWTYWRRVASCDCEGHTEGEYFVIENYASSPIAADPGELWWDIECELTFDIVALTGSSGCGAAEESTDSDGGGGGGCFVSSALSP